VSKHSTPSRKYQLYSDDKCYDRNNGSRILKSKAPNTSPPQHAQWLTFVPYSFHNMARWDPHRSTIVITPCSHIDQRYIFLIFLEITLFPRKDIFFDTLLIEVVQLPKYFECRLIVSNKEYYLIPYTCLLLWHCPGIYMALYEF
jgi:hypothetical protein